MKIPLDAIKELRKITSASVSVCREAIEASEGDVQKAVEILRQRGLELAAKKQERSAKDGRIEAYVHMGNKIGVLLEVDCETDFVARNPDFCRLTKDIAMQITACSPSYISKEDVPKETIEKEKDKESFYKTNCLLEQTFIKDPKITVRDYLFNLIAKMGENIVIRRFMRYKIGE